MKLGIVGLPQAGKSTIFSALTGARGEDEDRKGSRTDQRFGTVRVIDERVDFLEKTYKPGNSCPSIISKHPPWTGSSGPPIVS